MVFDVIDVEINMGPIELSSIRLAFFVCIWNFLPDNYSWHSRIQEDPINLPESLFKKFLFKSHSKSQILRFLRGTLLCALVAYGLWPFMSLDIWFKN